MSDEECKHDGDIIHVCDGKGKCLDCGMILSPNRLGEIASRREIKDLEKKNAELKNELMQIKMLLKEEGLLDAWEAAGRAAKLVPQKFSDVLSNKDKEN